MDNQLISEIFISLRSDKISIRKKGRKDCEDVIIRNNTIMASNSQLTSSLISSLMEYEIKEIDGEQTKGKKIPIEVAQFMKKCIKYIVNYCQLGTTVVSRIIDHSLTILNDSSLPHPYKDEHKIIVVEFLDNVEVSHNLPFQGNKACLQSLFYYLKEAMTDNKSICDIMNLKILRVLCKILYLDESSDPVKVLVSIINWFKQLYDICEELLPSVPLILSSTIIDCLLCFLHHQDINMLPIIINFKDFIFDLIIKQLQSLQQRESQRNSFISFLLLLFNIMNNYQTCFPLNIYTLLSPNINQLNMILLSADSLRNLILHGNLLLTITKQQSKDNFIYLLQDNRILSNFQVVAFTIYYNSRNLLIGSKNNNSEIILVENKKATSDRIEIITQSNKKPRLSYESTFTDNEIDYSINYSVDEIIDKIRLKVSNNQTRNSLFNGSFNNSIMILESWIYIIIVLCKEFDNGQFLIINEEKKDNSDDQHIAYYNFAMKFDKLVKLIHIVNLIIIGYINSSGNNNTQLVGAVLKLCIELCLLSNRIIKDYELFLKLKRRILFCDTSYQLLFSSYYNIAKIIDEIKAEWNSLYITILKYFKDVNMPKVKKNSLAELFIRIIDNIFKFELLPASVFSNSDHHWSLCIVNNVPFKDNIILFSYLSSVMIATNEDISQSINRNVIELVRQVATTDLKLNNVIDELVAVNDVDQESCQGLVYFSLFCILGLMDRSAENSANIVNNIIGSMSEFFRSFEVFIRVTVLINFNLGQLIKSEVLKIGNRPVDEYDSTTEYIFDRESEWFRGQKLSLSESFEQISQSHVDGVPIEITRNRLALMKSRLDRIISIVDIVTEVIMTYNNLFVDDTNADSCFHVLIIISFVLEMISTVVNLLDSIIVLNINNEGEMIQNILKDIDNQKSHLISTYVKILEKGLKQIQNKFNTIKIKSLSEYFEVLIRTSVKIHKSVKSNFDNTECSIALNSLLNVIHAQSFNQISIVDDIDFDLEKIGSQVPSSKKTSHGNSISNVDNDDFMEIESSNRRIAPIVASKKFSSQNSSDDMFFNATPQFKYKSKQSSTLVRSTYTNESISCFISVSQLMYLLSALTRSESIPLRLFGRAESNGRLNNVITSSKSYLQIAEGYAKINCVEYIEECFGLCGWHIDWGVLGYKKVLMIIFNITQKKCFWNDENNSLIEYFTNLLIPSEGVLQELIESYWHLRVIQLKAITHFILNYKDISTIKNDISAIFLNYIADSDLRVRLIASSKLPLLLKIFKNTEKVYNSLVEATGVSIVPPMYTHDDSSQFESNSTGRKERNPWSEENILFAYSTAIAISVMGRTNSCLLSKSLLDLMRLCSSRSKFSDSCDLVLYDQLLEILLTFMCKYIGYSSPRLLLTNHLRYISYYWLSEIDIGGCSDPSQIIQIMTLEDFPYKLIKKNGSLIEFLTAYQNLLIPVIVKISCPRRRWFILLEFIKCCGFHGTDGDIALLIKNNICEIKTLQISVSIIESKSVIDDISQSDYIQAFVERVLTNPSDIYLNLERFISDTVQSFFILMSYVPIDGSDTISLSSDHSDNDETVSLENYIGEVLKKNCQFVNVSDLSLLLKKCNLLEIISFLRCRLLETKTKSIGISIITSVKVIVKNLPFEQTKVISHSILCFVKDALNLFPELILHVSSIFCTLVSFLCMMKYDLRSSSSCSMLELLKELFAEFLCLLEIFHAIPKQNLTVDFIDEGESYNFSFQYYYELLEYYSDKGRYDQNILNLEKAKYLIQESFNDIITFCADHNYQKVLAPCFPIPKDIDVVLSRDTKVKISTSNKWKDVCAESIFIKMKSFNNMAQNILSGEKVPMSSVWIQITVLHSKLLESSAKDYWDDNSALISEFISCVTGLFQISCIINHPSDWTNTTSGGIVKDPFYSIRRVTVSLLGFLGSPDILSLKHNDFPYKLKSNIMSESNFDVILMKINLIKKLYMVLWDDPVAAREGSLCLRSMNLSGEYFSDLLVAVKFRKEDFPYLSSIIDYYRIPLRVKILQRSSINDHIQYHMLNCSNKINWKLGDIWNTNSKLCSSWLCLLCYYLIHNFVQTDETNDEIYADEKFDINLSIPSQSRGKRYSENYLYSLRFICLLRFDICKECFPLIVQFIIHSNGIGSLVVQSISDCLNKFVLNSDCNIEISKIGVKLLNFLLTHDIRQFLREKKDIASRNYKKVEVSKVMDDSDAENEWKLPFSFILNVDFKYAAATAIRCNNICSALLFAELSNDNGRRYPMFSIKISEDLNNILIPIYKVIHDAHAIYGLDLTSSLPLQALMYSERGDWMEALLSYESAFQSQEKVNRKESDKLTCDSFTSGVVKSLHGLGALGTLSLFADHHCDNEAKKLLNESVWRLGKSAINSLQSWSLPSDSSSVVGRSSSLLSNSHRTLTALQNITSDSINRSISVIIDYISKMDITSAERKIDQSVDSLFNDILRNINDETASNVINNISQAQQLIELRDVCSIIDSNDQLYSDKVLSRWSSFQEGTSRGSRSINTESQLALRSRLLQQLLFVNKASPLQVLNCMNKMYPDLKSKEFAFSTSPILYKFWSSVSNEINKSKLSPKMSYLKCILQASSDSQECKLLWKKGLRDIAITSLNRNVIDQLKILLPNSTSDDPRKNLLSTALRLCGEWTSTRRAATGTEIIVEYLRPAAQIACSEEEKTKAYITLAAFNARLYHNVKDKVSSEEWKQGGRVLNDRIKEFDKCKALQLELMQAAKRNENPVDNGGIDIKALYRHIATLKKEIELDSNERTAVEVSIEAFLTDALLEYAKVLELSCEDDLDLVFTFVNLWLSNSSNSNVNNIINDVVSKISSYKFVPLTYQILSRLGSAGTSDKSIQGRKLDFQSVLVKVVYKLCCEHPYHTLPQLFALTNERDLTSVYDGAEQFLSNTSNSRLEKANSIVKQLKETNLLSSLVCSTEILLSKYIILAQCSTEIFQKNGKTRDIKFKEIQSRDDRFNDCMNSVETKPAVLTLQHPIMKTGNYNDVIKINTFLPNFSITEHGISRPKIITCIGSDGKFYKQLVKGGDDMRQDAVMEQVFETVNYTLSHDSETRKKRLKIRTYKIVPTTPQTGVLQWVENTQAFGGILTDKDKGLHARYYPNDWTHSECRNYLKDATDNNDKLERFHNICGSFNPAFRFFFIENFCDPTEWVTARLAYIRSVAINSVVGYILGIGDRHAHNILVDTLTGEVVHIDFGIVYEQGKGLGSPETVPFRLTRNIVDGMGVTGWEGTFRKTCEEVLRVLRDNTQQIMVILEVVMYDPLYKWSLSPLQARMKQKSLFEYDDNEPVIKKRKKSLPAADNSAYSIDDNKTSFGKDAAERTLIRIKNKLQGLEDPTGEALGIEGQIDYLINEAKSHSNLCKLFPGWAPWL